MKNVLKVVMTGFILLCCVQICAQNKVSLLPADMVKYLGTVDRPAFEKVVGEAVDSIAETNTFVYRVINAYSNLPTQLHIIYNVHTGKLANVRFGAMKHLGYWMSFSKLPGFSAKRDQTIAGNPEHRVTLRCGKVLCILDNIEYAYGGESYVTVIYGLKP